MNYNQKAKKLGSKISYSGKAVKVAYEISTVAFADTRKGSSSGQLGVIIGLLIGELKTGSIFHTIPWISHKFKRPLKSTSAAEIFATSEAIDEAKVIENTNKGLLGITLTVCIVLNTKGLCRSLSTQKQSIDWTTIGD